MLDHVSLPVADLERACTRATHIGASSQGGDQSQANDPDGDVVTTGALDRCAGHEFDLCDRYTCARGSGIASVGAHEPRMTEEEERRIREEAMSTCTGKPE
jgi:hypothetical protein